MKEKIIIGNPNNDIVFNSSNKYNTDVKLTPEDKKSNKTRILSKEPYAQELYDAFNHYYSENEECLNYSKDLSIGQICNVRAVQVSFQDRLILVKDTNSQVEISIPFKEFSRPIQELIEGDGVNFNIAIQKSDSHGGYFGSEKKCIHINYKQELFDNFENNKWFEVTIKKLIKGGYLASYNGVVDCFIPGSHAGANVIRDFSKLLGKTINVMVDNYDKSNDLFILSYKKYIKKSMPIRVSDINFREKYTGTLTNKPYDFGIFVEFDDYFTGLIHSSEFENYSNIRKTLKAGDPIDFYVKNVTNKGKEYRIILTLKEDEIDPVKKQWSTFKDQIENTKIDYSIDYDNESIVIKVDDMEIPIPMKKKDLEKNLEDFPKILVTKVDPINKRIKFEFVI